MSHAKRAACVVLCAAITLIGLGETPSRAQTALPAEGKTPGHDAAACVLKPKPDTLLSLAACCAQDISSNASCRLYEAKDKYVIVKDNDPKKPDAYLIIPTITVTGVEDSQIFNLPVLDFWEDGFFRSAKYPGQPAARTALAINSVHGRDQNQLHIHISCVRPDVSKLLVNVKQMSSDPAKPTTLNLPPHNNPYEAVKVAGLTGKSSPFEIIQAFPGVKNHMADQSIAVVGSSKAGEYYVLDTYAHGTNPGMAEELLDQTCKMPGGQR
jgi:CDP-diacylglycerol pyrophosphatase